MHMHARTYTHTTSFTHAGAGFLSPDRASFSSRTVQLPPREDLGVTRAMVERHLKQARTRSQLEAGNFVDSEVVDNRVRR